MPLDGSTSTSTLFLVCSIILYLSFTFSGFHYVADFSFEKSPRHDAFVPKFEAELAQFCEKLVGYLPVAIPSQYSKEFILVCMSMIHSSYFLVIITGDGLG